MSDNSKLYDLIRKLDWLEEHPSATGFAQLRTEISSLTLATDTTSDLSDAQIKSVFQSLKAAYSELNGPAFFTLLGFNPKWDMKYWTYWMEGIDALFNLSESNLIKLVRAGWQIRRK